jgi:hypothetical protein
MSYWTRQCQFTAAIAEACGHRSPATYGLGRTLALVSLMAAGLAGRVMAIEGNFAGAASQESRNDMRIVVEPRAPGEQVVRASLPFTRGLVGENQALLVSDGKAEIASSLRPLTWHPPIGGEAKSVRRGLLTFPYTFAGEGAVEFRLRPRPVDDDKPALPVAVSFDGESVIVAYENGPRLSARLIAPARASTACAKAETVERNHHFLWQRQLFDDPQWPRVIEIRADAAGQVVVIAHLQSKLVGFGSAPDFGWRIETEAPPSYLLSGEQRVQVSEEGSSHRFSEETPCALYFEGGRYRIYHPVAPLTQRGEVEARTSHGGLAYRYQRCAAEDKVPMQQASWLRAEFVVAPAGLATLTPILESPHVISLDWHLWDELYGTGPPLELGGQPELAKLVQYHHEAIVRAMAHGDDLGSVSGFSDSQRTGRPGGTDRFNHCPPIFEEGWRSGDNSLTEVATLWCQNFYDRCIWWGPEETGGTRYPATRDQEGVEGRWRSNSAVDFCTKGMDSFFLAYEQTGDPRMLEALNTQLAYSSEQLHADTGECRNVGDVRDLVRLYQYTGDTRYPELALRLFRELRTKLSPGDLFSPEGTPIEDNPPFVEEQDFRWQHPSATPYNIGYALSGLPELLRYAPNEPKLRDVIAATADFLADSQDPVGGWRYPHPRASSLILSQGIEHAWHLVQADRALGLKEKHLDAIERVLRQRVLSWVSTGRVLDDLEGWEISTGKVKARTELQELYKHPSDRDLSRDYTEGAISVGSSAPEGLVYFPEVLGFYLEHRPAERLLAPPQDNDPLGIVLSRIKQGSVQ